MQRLYILFLLLQFIINYSYSQNQKMTLQELEAQIHQQFISTPGDFALAMKSLNKPGEKLLINEKVVFHAASTMKTPVMIEVYKQAAAGTFSLTDSILVKNEFKSIVDGSLYSMDIQDDSGEGLYQMIGKKTTIRALIYDMITYSSNLATNILIDLVDAKNVMRMMRKLGAKDIQVLRGVEDDKAFEKGLNNTTTAYDLLLIFEKLATGKILNEKATKDMMNILLDQQFNEIIPGLLPKEVKVAHKTGSITGVQHDSGIVYLPDGRKYVLILLSKNLKDPKQGVKLLAQVSRKIYDFME